MHGPRYGVDAPLVQLGFAAGTAIALALAVWAATNPWPWLAAAALLGAQGVIYLHTTLRGKLRIWERLLDDLDLARDERLLDLGCGRGAVLVAAALRLPEGAVVGVDLWRSVDQSGNDESVTRANAVAAGVGDRVELETGDVTELPFPDHTFDVVVSSLVIHNIHDPGRRDKAISEALRVLRPGGRLVIADISHIADYSTALRAGGATKVTMSDLGVNGWFGHPWVRMRAVTAVAPV